MITVFGVISIGTGQRTDRHRLAGSVTVDGQPARRFIAVFDRRNCAWVAGTVSDPATGAWEITGVAEYPERVLIVVALDTTGAYNAEVADYVSQVATT
jgi:hypothetical protein